MKANDNYVHMTEEQFEAFNDLPVVGTFQMLNLLKFKEKVEGSDMSGAKAYALYMNAVLPFFQASGAKVVYQGRSQFTLIGPDDTEWDKVLIIEYASKQDFLKMITTEGYPAAMRSRALQDSRLILCKE
ncbi:hypothetical protein ACFQ1M_06915 [Sungkyunkwania multivorans]|uniref:DUF1330 domain-containing protein n=1 Tax=Sungkyunkwania multivorans TaxID=1173618 RepID=A0ABW3CYM5_9FLAO